MRDRSGFRSRCPGLPAGKRSTEGSIADVWVHCGVCVVGMRDSNRVILDITRIFVYNENNVSKAKCIQIMAIDYDVSFIGAWTLDF